MAVELETILVGVDHSEASRWAVERAAWLPRSDESVVTLLRVIHRDLQLAPLLDALAEDDAPALLEEAQQAARAAAAASGASMHVLSAVCHGIPFVEIIRRAREDRADLILVGGQTTRMLGDAFIGSTAERVVRKAGNPVLVVAKRPSGPYRHPLVAVDLSPTSQRAAALALRLVSPGVTTVDVVHAKGPAHSEAEVLRAVAECLAPIGRPGIEWNVIVRDGDARRVILHEAAERQADVLVLGTHGRSAIPHLLIGSVAEGVVRAASCDVGVARPEKHIFSMP